MIMQLADINFLDLTEHSGIGNVPKPSVYSDDHFFYKVIHDVSKYSRTSLAYYVIDGLDFKWIGQTQLAADRAGLLTKDTVPAFKEFIYDKDICCGYVMHRGDPLVEPLSELERLDYLRFVKNLALTSLECGYGIVSANLNNIVRFDGGLSLIDLDFSPIKLSHGIEFTPSEQLLWENEFRCYDGVYLSMIKTGLNK